MFLTRFIVTFALKYNYFRIYFLLQPSASRRNSCQNTLSERGVCTQNHSSANERRGPAHTVTVVYYSSSVPIGGKVGKKNQALCCVQTHKKVQEFGTFWLKIRSHFRFSSGTPPHSPMFLACPPPPIPLNPDCKRIITVHWSPSSLSKLGHLKILFSLVVLYFWSKLVFVFAVEQTEMDLESQLLFILVLMAHITEYFSSLPALPTPYQPDQVCLANKYLKGTNS